MIPYVTEDGRSLQPLRGLVVLRPFELCENYRSVGSVIIPDNVRNWIPPQQGEVIALGPGAEKLSLGDVVVYGLGSGKDVVLDGKLALILDESEVIGRLEVN